MGGVCLRLSGAEAASPLVTYKVVALVLVFMMFTRLGANGGFEQFVGRVDAGFQFYLGGKAFRDRRVVVSVLVKLFEW